MKDNKIIFGLIGYYTAFLGLAVIVAWFQILLNEPITEGKSELIFHLFSEFIMALVCITGGYKFLKKQKTGLFLIVIAHSMIIYSVLNAAGYYAEKEKFALTLVFLLLFIISVLVLATVSGYYKYL